MRTYFYRQESVDMLESGFAEERQSQGVVDHGKLAESWSCCWSRQRCLFFLLVFGVVLFFYMTNQKQMVPDFNPKMLLQYKAFKWFHPESITSTNVTDTTDTPHQTSNATELTPVTPVPYKSPGPYVVEYPYKYNFIIDQPDMCEQQNLFLVLMVPVAPNNKAHRDIIRSTWGGEGLVLGQVVRLLFVLGLQTGDGAEGQREQLLQESEEHRDLIQSDFLDCYKNLTIKTMVMLEWLDSHCSNAAYAMKIDSDMFLNVPNLIKMLLNAPKKDYLTGLVARGGRVLRDPKSKWYVPVDLYRPQHYPKYALGLGYVFSLDLPKKLVEASRDVQALYIEDVYVGLCMQHLGISPTDPPDEGYFFVFPVTYSRCAYSRLIATTTHEHSDRMWIWNDFKKPGPHC